ncbi:MAG TPA: PSD1 and planctomycete cytochrome C domain-containing protein [Bryobacteraceae bacterium]|nr:PSD1 and planctomycete cytochrome C domain-containing protein [Bryobacteraceae bacterium]
MKRLFLSCVALTAALGADKQLPPAASGQVDFAQDIEPLLKGKCLACHGAAQQLSGLRLDDREQALKGGYSGAVIRPGDSAKSRLIHLVAGAEENVVMPPAGKRLTDAEVGVLRAWIDQGAKWPVGAKSATAAAAKTTTHWSFQSVARREPPQTQNTAWTRNEVDRFILARLEKEGFKPSADAEKSTLIRRLTLDLIGLPPKPAEVEAFLRDSRPDAYERLVDRLLVAPHFGEKWARHWLDLARYADSDGYEKDYVRPHAWRYRHWVIDALNRDMPFDQFTVEQIAGDLLPNATVEQRVATGFHRNTLTNREGGVNIEQFRNEQVVDRASTVGTVWLGLTVGCAQCHDHKFDPVTQKEFYQLFAFFNNAAEVDIEAPLEGEYGPYLQALPEYRRRRDAILTKFGVLPLQAEWEERMKEAASSPGKWTDWDHAFDALQKYLDNGERILRTPPAERSTRDADSLTDHFVINYHRVISKERIKELNYSAARKELTELAAAFPAISLAPTIASDTVRRKTHLHVRGDWRRPGIEVSPGVPSFLPPLARGDAPDRLKLARWIVSPGNPLTARVAVNRIWQEYFGRGLVRTSEDFGKQGEKPSHPELLDWLASRFIDSGWQIKDLHRLIVTSATYRQSSASRPDVEARDPDNALLAKQSRLRLPAEAIRDSALAVSELLYPEIGGKSVRPPQPAGVAELAYANSVKWNESQGPSRYRRGLYVHFQRTVPYPQLMNFDAPDANTASCRRNRSTTPLQALNLLNDPVFLEAAQALAARLIRELPQAPLEQRITRAFQVCLSRSPNPKESEALTDYYREQSRIFERDTASAEKLWPLELSKESRVEAASLVALGSVLLNLDEFIRRE